jgi:hypothetical protein
MGSAIVHIADQRPYSSHSETFHCEYNVSVLKSNLQKCVRRRRNVEALATARQFLYQDPSEMLRRLPIIMCEDAMLCPSLFCELVWLMAAVSKGYVLNADDGGVVLRAVQTALDAPGRYNLDVMGEGAPEEPVEGSDATDLAFRLRIAYGGMTGDAEMLDKLRLRYATGTLPCVEASTTHGDVERFDPRRHLIPYAIDFHCFPVLLKANPYLTKGAVWWHWSSLNVRPPVGSGAEAVIEAEARHRSIHVLAPYGRTTLETFAAQKIEWIAAAATAAVATTKVIKRQGTLDAFRKKDA